MKVITEAIIRKELKATQHEVYYIPEGKILSPAAREYLQQLQIDIDFEKNRSIREGKSKKTKVENSGSKTAQPDSEGIKARYIDYETGAGYAAKPEHMTQLFGKMLVDKNHPRIKYRGKLDRLQAEIINAQCVIVAESGNKKLIEDLGSVLDAARGLMKSEVLDEEVDVPVMIGLNHEELRDHSHHPMKYYKIKQMLLPDYTMGIEYAWLNLIRTSVRETEVIAIDTFKEKRKLERRDIVQTLNRMSSALHIMMCKYLAGEYK